MSAKEVKNLKKRKENIPKPMPPENEDDVLRTVILSSVSAQDVLAGGASIIGSRSSQQDFYIMDNNSDYNADKRFIAVLCDGMGGLSCGEKASAACAEMVYRAFHEIDLIDSYSDFYRFVIEQADMEVALIRNEAERVSRAGTTLVSAVIADGYLHWASVGDSHIYLISGGNIKRIVNEHNYTMLLNDKVKRGEISQSDADRDPQKDALISYIGMGGVRCVDINAKPYPLKSGDYVVLCSDGVYRTLDDAKLCDIILKNKSNVQKSANEIVDLITLLKAKGQDNATVAIMQYYDSG